MSDLGDDEIKSIERSLGGPSRVAVSNSETCRMLAELQRRRSADLTADDAEALRAIRRLVVNTAMSCSDQQPYVPWIAALDRLLSSHGARP